MSTLNDSLIGKRLDEYQIDKALGVGGMARVYRALDTKLRRYVALKVIAPDFRADVDYAQRFEREAQSIARLDQPNIVHIYRFGEADGLYYIAMQYVEGADLAWLIEDYKRDDELMPVPDVVRIIRDIGEALDYAHSKNVIHRDVKPGNIMINNQGRTILTDFGLALLSDVGTQGQIFGSPYYIAPEQAISSGNVVPQTDLYALGVTLFEMLTGELPFTGGEAMDIAMRHVSEPPPPPSHFNHAVPPGVDEVVLRSLEKEPYARYQTGAEFSIALEHAVDNWHADNLPATQGVRRPSLVIAPQKVSELLKSSPVPPPESVPPGLPAENVAYTPSNTPPFDVPDMPPTLPPAPSLAETRTARPADITAPTTPANILPADRRPPWLLPALFGATFFAIGLIVLIFILLAARGGSQPVAALPTATVANTANTTTTANTGSAAAAASTVSPTGSVSTASAAISPSAVPATALPTQAPTATPVVLTAAPALPTATRGPIPPPSDRSVPPPGSRRLGEFAVEAYCNSQGYNIILTNNRVDWACTNKSNGKIAFILQPSDFDKICRAKYNPNAFAIRDQHNAVLAYNWSCYDYVIAPTQVPPTSISGATPSVLTLVARFGKDWVALVNTSSTPLSMAGVEFRRPDGALSAAAWGHLLLMPGECLRMYAGDQAPADLPSKCTTAIDYAAPKAERQRWFDGPVIIAINPDTTYCYPSDKCSQ